MKTTKSYNKYIQLYGPHFNKLLCEFAVGLMETKSGKIVPFTKTQLEEKLKACGVTLEYNKLEDFVYVANMCKADFLGSSVPNEQYLAKYVKDVITDPDGYKGLVFYRWYADMCKQGIIIDWENMI